MRSAVGLRAIYFLGLSINAALWCNSHDEDRDHPPEHIVTAIKEQYAA
jgi:hypothetical protein